LTTCYLIDFPAPVLRDAITRTGAASGGSSSVQTRDGRPPNIRAQLGQREPGVMGNYALTEIGARLASATRAQIEIVDVRINSLSENLTLSGLRRLEVGAKIHLIASRAKCAVSIDQKDLYKQIFLHVDQND
jgi:hypothetical protein